MRPKRSTIECSNILLAALERERTLGRSQIVDQGMLSGDEFSRALRNLVRSGLICHSPGRVDAGKRDTRYELTAKALELSGESRLLSQQAPADANFDSLLGAWEIKLPLMPADLPSVKRQRFAKDEAEIEDGTTNSRCGS